MLNKILLIVLISVCLFSCNRPQQQSVKRPKIVIGLVIDQMRWDYLYRYANRYGNNGFKRLLREGFACQHTMLNYIPANTAPGHACIYTGSVPSLHGIAGNNWINNDNGEYVYCVDDSTVNPTGTTGVRGSYSPRNLLATTITDELRLATNQRSKVYGIAIKDRGAILPAGHLANGAYWYNDKNGNFVSSTYYPNNSPEWLKNFNGRRIADSLSKLSWHLLYDASTYVQSTMDATNYEKGFSGEKAPIFPHLTDSLNDSDRLSIIKTFPAGNTLSIMMAKACLEGEKMGSGNETDFLALSLSSTDYAGHQFGPNSIELEDMYLRLDEEIARLLQYLDGRYGRNNYLFFLTADHGGAHNSVYLEDLDIPAGVTYKGLIPELNTTLQKKYGSDSLVLGMVNNQVFFNYALIEKKKLDIAGIKASSCSWLNKRPEISYVIDMEKIDATPIPEMVKQMVINGYNKARSGGIQLIFNPAWYDNGGKYTGMTHGAWNPYDTHIPLIWYGWNVNRGCTNQSTSMTDISATLAALLHIQMPNACIGHVITEVIKEP